MYIVTKHFTDLQDEGHPYEVGEIFPREGLEVSEERLKELAGTGNKRGESLIIAVKGVAIAAPAAEAAEEAEEAPEEPKAKTKAKGKASEK